MLFYATKKTIETYNLKLPEELSSEVRFFARAVVLKERGNSLYEWGCKYFKVDNFNCLQYVHFATKLTIFLINIEQSEIDYAANAVAKYVIYLYRDDKVMKRALERYYESALLAVFDKLTDKSIIAQLNSMQKNQMLDGARLRDYIENGVLLTKKLNEDVNREWVFFRTVDGKKNPFSPVDEFEKLIKKNFAK